MKDFKIHLEEDFVDETHTLYEVCWDSVHKDYPKDPIVVGQKKTFSGKARERSRFILKEKCHEFLGCGTFKDINNLNEFRSCIGKIYREAQELKCKDVQLRLWLPQNLTQSVILRLCEVLAETWGLARGADAEFDHPLHFHNETKEQKPLTTDLIVSLKESGKAAVRVPLSAAQKALDAGIFASQQLNMARFLGDLPANILTPKRLAEWGHDILKGWVKTTLFDADELKKRGFGGVMAVGQGSHFSPYVAVYDYVPKKFRRTLVLVGKGLTFDTGGYSIKPKERHNEMKFDMCGAANLLAAMRIILEQEPPVRIVGILGCVENMVSAQAQRPGDVYRTWDGRLVEVLNTDAEGRLVLADLLSYAKTFDPELVIDIATLTGGAAQIAGNMGGIVCTNDDSLNAEVKAACSKAGEYFVPLEILPPCFEDIKGTSGHLTNIHNDWKTGAPTMIAAAFLKHFIPEKSDWIHLDIANVAWNARPNGYLSGRGATSYGARTLVELLRARIAKGSPKGV